jgi:hypothetical protein
MSSVSIESLHHSAATKALSVAERPWIQSPLWDGFWMFSGIWGSALLFLGSVAFGWQRTATVLFAGNAIIAIYHSWSTIFMVLGSPCLRTVREENRTRYVYVPIAIVCVGMIAGLFTGRELIFPSTAHYGYEYWPWVVYLGLFWIGHFWHFSRQDFGVLSIYRARAGQNDPEARRTDRFFTIAMMIIIQPILYVSVGISSPLGEAFYSFIPVSPNVVQNISGFAFELASGLTIVVVFLEVFRPNTSLPKLAYYCIMLAHSAVFYFADSEFKLFFFTTYLWSHWFVAIGLVSRINTSHHKQNGVKPFKASVRHWGTISAIVCVLAFLTRDIEDFAVFSGREYKQILATFTPDQGLFIGLVLGAFLAEQLLHYYCDRSLFRMRAPEIRKTIGPLL